MEKFNLLKHLLGRQGRTPLSATTGPASKDRPVVAVAPDKFKGTLAAGEVAHAIAAMLERELEAEVREYPMADGGEGTARILAREMLLGETTADGHDAYMRPTSITYYSHDTTVAIDSAAVVGLTGAAHLPDAWQASSYGLGEFVAGCIARGARKIYIGIGGTGCTDGGIGFLQALGTRFYDISGRTLGNNRPLAAADLPFIYGVDFGGIDRRKLREIIVGLADVDVPLTPIRDGIMTDGLSTISFARQKGIPENNLPDLAHALENLQTAVDNELLQPAIQPRFQGAGGGLGYAIGRVIKAPINAGARYISNLYGIFITDPAPDLIITGEGCFDKQTAGGKVVAEILRHAGSRNIPAMIVAGKATAQFPSLLETSAFMGDNQLLTHDSAWQALMAALPHIAASAKKILTDSAR